MEWSSNTKKYIYGPGIDNPVAMINVSGANETWYYYYADALGSIRLLSDAGGAIVESYTYLAFGQPTVMTNAGTDGNWLTEDGTTINTSAVGNPYLFTARRWDFYTQLYYYRFRDYSPLIGRFLQPDPLGYIDGLNLYAYCANNPVNYVDPWGLYGDGMEKSVDEGTWNPNVLPGHSDFGDGWKNGFDYTKEDNDWRTSPTHPLGSPKNHFRPRYDVERELIDAVERGDKERFERLMHQGQDTFSHYDKGYRWPSTLGHLFGGHESDYPYDKNGNYNKAFRDADRWTRNWERRWNDAREKEKKGS